MDPPVPSSGFALICRMLVRVFNPGRARGPHAGCVSGGGWYHRVESWDQPPFFILGLALLLPCPPARVKHPSSSRGVVQGRDYGDGGLFLFYCDLTRKNRLAKFLSFGSLKYDQPSVRVLVDTEDQVWFARVVDASTTTAAFVAQEILKPNWLF